MKIVVDEILCAGHGVCVDAAPLLFVVEDSGIARVLVDEIGDEDLPAARSAMQRCPAEAITIVP